MSDEARKIHIFTEIKTAPPIQLIVLCDDGCTITLEQKYTEVQNNGQKILRV